jgi:hypothetical protein
MISLCDAVCSLIQTSTTKTHENTKPYSSNNTRIEAKQPTTRRAHTTWARSSAVRLEKNKCTHANTSKHPVLGGFTLASLLLAVVIIIVVVVDQLTTNI